MRRRTAVAMEWPVATESLAASGALRQRHLAPVWRWQEHWLDRHRRTAVAMDGAVGDPGIMSLIDTFDRGFGAIYLSRCSKTTYDWSGAIAKQRGADLKVECANEFRAWLKQTIPGMAEPGRLSSIPDDERKYIPRPSGCPYSPWAYWGSRKRVFIWQKMLR